MKFFGKLKGTLKRKNLIQGLLFLALTVVVVALVVNLGFSADADYQIGLRGLDSGIPIPNWLLSGVFCVVALVLLYQSFSRFKSFACNTEFNAFMETVRQIGDPEVIGNSLSTAKKAKDNLSGELMYNSSYIYYRNGREATIIDAAKVVKVQAEKTKTKNGTDFFASVYYADKVLKIAAVEKKVLPLVKDILSTLRQTPVA